ncbi:MAG: acyltransferase family protein [Prevotella sp.]|nr:acyltransferase family protein [Prevotella sp.]
MSDETLSIVEKHRLSETITFLRFPLTMIIVMYHCYCVQTPNNQPLYAAVTYPFGLMIGETGVPAFFFISGFLFFFSQRKYSQKLRTRLNTLLVPYLIWNAVVLLGYIALMVVGHPLQIADKNILDFQFIDYIRAFVDRGQWEHGNGQPLLCPYWYIRNLIVLSLAAPLIGIAMKGRKALAILFTLLIWWLSLPYNGMIAQSLLFFSMGSLFSVNKISPLALTKGRTGHIIIMLWCLAVVYDWLSHFCCPIWGSLYVHRLVLILNIFMLFYVGSHIFMKYKMPEILTKSSFWIYTTHYPLTLLIRSAHPQLGDWVQVVFYWTSVFVITLVCLASFWLGRRLSPKVMNVLTGNR